MRKLFKDLTTEENITNMGRVVAIFVIILAVVVFIQAMTEPQSISFGMIE